jgi:hypothetical protein
MLISDKDRVKNALLAIIHMQDDLLNVDPGDTPEQRQELEDAIAELKRNVGF